MSTDNKLFTGWKSLINCYARCRYSERRSTELQNALKYYWK